MNPLAKKSLASQTTGRACTIVYSCLFLSHPSPSQHSPLPFCGVDTTAATWDKTRKSGLFCHADRAVRNLGAIMPSPLSFLSLPA